MSPARRALVLVNPAAGRGRASGERAQVEAFLRSQREPAEFVVPSSAAEIRRLAGGAASAGYTHVIAMGGDGTFHEVLNGACGSDIVLGLFPAGGGNDIARALRLPWDTVAAARAFLSASARPRDVLRVRDASGRSTLFFGAGGLGLDAEAARLANGRFQALPGILRYFVAAIAAFANFRPLALEFEVDGERARALALLMAVANAPSYGSGVIVAPEAELDDGLMDLMLVGPLDWTQVLDALLMALRTGDIRWPEIRRWRARRVRLAADRPAMFHGDGEMLGEAPLEIEVLPGAVRVAA